MSDMSNVTPASTVKPACVNCLELIDKICPRCFKCKTCCDHTNSEFTKLKGTNAIIRRIPEKSILLTHHLTDTVTREIKSGRHSILCGHQWHEVPSQKRRFDEGFADYVCSKCRITVSVTVRTEHIFKQNKICNECGKLDPYTEYHIIKGTVYDICEKCHNHLEIKYEYDL